MEILNSTLIILTSSILILSVFLTYIIRIVAIRKNVIDLPNERSSHSIPTPRGGGLAIVICWYLGITILFFLKKIDPQLYFAFIPGILLAVVGVIDDIVSLKPGIRLIMQTITATASIVILKGISVYGYDANLIITIILGGIGVFSIVWFINLYNFLDGIDAYASLEAIFIATSLLILTSEPVLILLIASVLGFLFWNWPKAKIFMGDVGSTQLGYVLIVFGIYFHNVNELNILYWIVLSSVFWFDATYTLFRRWKNKERLSQAHKKHAYQRYVQSGASHLMTNIYALLINIVLLVTVLVTKNIGIHAWYAIVFTVILLWLVNWKVDNLFPFKK